jgi:hypothetical protein
LDALPNGTARLAFYGVGKFRIWRKDLSPITTRARPRVLVRKSGEAHDGFALIGRLAISADQGAKVFPSGAGERPRH